MGNFSTFNESVLKMYSYFIILLFSYVNNNWLFSIEDKIATDASKPYKTFGSWTNLIIRDNIKHLRNGTMSAKY